MKFNKKTLIRWKVYIDRSRMYVGYIQFFLIGIVFLEGYRDTWIGERVFRYTLISIPVFIVLFLLLSLVLGYLDTKFGFRQEEQRNISTSNPVMMEIIDLLRKINEKIENYDSKI